LSGSLGKLKKIYSKDPVLNQIQDQLIAVLNPILSNPLLSGNIIKNVSLVNTHDNQINHGLGVAYQGVIPLVSVSSKGFTQVWISDTNNNSKDKFVLLNCMDSMTCDFIIF
jgi:hypothetical protein